MEAKYRRVVLKLSGEALAGDQGFGINPAVVEEIAAQIKKVRDHGIDVAIVVGGGNIWRGLAGSAKGMDRTTADYMGMMATVMNALALQDALEKQDVDTRVQSAIEMRQVAEPYIRYDSDPNKNPDAHRFETLTYIDILKKGLAVMDATATSLCMENKIPIVVFNIDEHANIARASFGEPIGTTVGGEAV